MLFEGCTDGLLVILIALKALQVKIHHAYEHGPFKFDRFSTGKTNNLFFFATVVGHWKESNKNFCLQFFRNVTKGIIASLQDMDAEAVELWRLVDSTGNQGYTKALKNSLMDITAWCTLVHSSLMTASQMDSLRSENGSTISESITFYRELFTSEYVEDEDVARPSPADLAHVDSDSNAVWDEELWELYAALMSLENSEAPSIDRLPVEF